jgi:glycosyltransferase involved in cell wall biosynthesis
VRLVRVGGPFPPAHQQLALNLGVDDRISVLPSLDRQLLAAVYRRAALLLLTSEREGFGLPLVESLASGTPVVASDLPVLREVGGPAAAYCRMGVVEAWTETVVRLLRERDEDRTAWQSRRAAGVRWAERFSWHAHARQMTTLYRELLS